MAHGLAWHDSERNCFKIPLLHKLMLDLDSLVVDTTKLPWLANQQSVFFSDRTGLCISDV